MRPKTLTYVISTIVFPFMQRQFFLKKVECDDGAGIGGCTYSGEQMKRTPCRLATGFIWPFSSSNDVVSLCVELHFTGKTDSNSKMTFCKQITWK